MRTSAERGQPDACGLGHRLTWVTPDVAVCACAGSHIWRWEPKRKALRVESNAVAKGLANALRAGTEPAPAQPEGDTEMTADNPTGAIHVAGNGAVVGYERDSALPVGVSLAQIKAAASHAAEDAGRYAAACRRRYDELLKRTEGYRVGMALLKIDRSYQRDVERAHVDRMKRDFDPLLVGTLAVSMREDGEMYVLDGQQRLQVFRELGFGDRPVDAKVWVGLSETEEARVFLGLNASKTIGAASRLRARRAAGYRDAAEIDAAIREAGFEVDYRNGQKPYQIAAVTAVEAVYDAAGGLEHGGFPRTRDALILHRKLWHGRRTYESALIRAAGAFTIRHYGHIKTDLLVRRFQPDKTALKTGLPWSAQVLVSEGAGRFDRQPAAGAAFILALEHDNIRAPGKATFKPAGAAGYLLPEVKRARARGEC